MQTAQSGTGRIFRHGNEHSAYVLADEDQRRDLSQLSECQALGADRRM
jgi:hypothetical protein